MTPTTTTIDLTCADCACSICSCNTPSAISLTFSGGVRGPGSTGRVPFDPTQLDGLGVELAPYPTANPAYSNVYGGGPTGLPCAFAATGGFFTFPGYPYNQGAGAPPSTSNELFLWAQIIGPGTSGVGITIDLNLYAIGLTWFTGGPASYGSISSTTCYEQTGSLALFVDTGSVNVAFEFIP